MMFEVTALAVDPCAYEENISCYIFINPVCTINAGALVIAVLVHFDTSIIKLAHCHGLYHDRIKVMCCHPIVTADIHSHLFFLIKYPCPASWQLQQSEMRLFDLFMLKSHHGGASIGYIISKAFSPLLSLCIARIHFFLLCIFQKTSNSENFISSGISFHVLA